MNRKKIGSLFYLLPLFLFLSAMASAGGKPPLFFGPLKPIPYQKVPAGLKTLSAEGCKECHPKIYAEWKASMHSKATGDPIFQICWTNRNKPPWCTNCHFPLANQKPKRVVASRETGPLPRILLPNPKFDPVLLKEGVTCAVCHVRGGVVLGPRQLAEGESPHPVAYDERFQSAEFCYACHGWTFPRARVPAVCDNTYEYMKFKSEDTPSCQVCHMPRVQGEVATGGQVREYGVHTANSAHDPKEIASAFTFDLKMDKETYKPGDTVNALVSLTNSGAAHRVPTACGVRALFLKFSVLDGSGKALATEEYRLSRATEFPEYPTETDDTRLNPGETRALPFSLAIPGGQEGMGLILKVELTYYLVSPQKAEEAPLPLGSVAIPVMEKVAPLT